jgi:hypothetical protein
MYFSFANVQLNTVSASPAFAPTLTATSGSVWTLTDTPFDSVADSSRVSDSDFGELTSRQTLFRQRVGRYIVSKPLTILTYWNADGYTSVVSDFDSLYGYGESVQTSIDDVLIHLEQDRSFYGQIQDGTEAALELRARLQSYLVSFFK